MRKTASATSGTASFGEADAELASTLENLDDAHRYAEWIFSLFEPYLGARVLEVGAGHGTFTAMLSRDHEVFATDLSERCVRALRKRFDTVSGVKIAMCDLAGAAPDSPYDTVVLVNVLEHIVDDQEALEQIWRLLSPAGKVILWVPALSQLFSDFDRRIGHHRRYHLEALRQQLLDAGFAVDYSRYVNSVGALAWWVIATKLRREPTQRLPIQVYDRLAVPVLRRVESRWTPPLGQSILAVATKACK